MNYASLDMVSGNISDKQNLARAGGAKYLEHHLLLGEDDSPAFHQQVSSVSSPVAAAVLAGIQDN
jgi:hypothetical protein